MKIIIILVLFITIVCKLQTIKQSTASVERPNKEMEQQDMRFKEKSTAKLGNYAGWIKFVEVKESDAILPGNFAVNVEYRNQINDNKTIDSKQADIFGYLNIPSDVYFYAILNKTSLTIYTARSAPYKKELKVGLIEEILQQESVEPKLMGGIENLGDFPEGNCFVVKFRRADNYFMWELCSDTKEEKDNWVKTLLEAKCPDLKCLSKDLSAKSNFQQVDIWQEVEAWSPCSKTCGTGESVRKLKCLNENYCSGTRVERKECLLKICSQVSNQAFLQPAKITYLGDWSDCSAPCGGGFTVRKQCQDLTCNETIIVRKECNVESCPSDQWKYVSDWSPCSATCGGGVRQKSRICVRSQCEGSTVIEEKCNDTPCSSNFGSIGSDIDDCQMKEIEMITLAKDNLNLKAKVIFSADAIKVMTSGQNEFVTFNTSQIDHISIYPNNQKCFEIGQNSTKAVLCRDTESDCDKWVHKILDFKTKCAGRILDKIAVEACKPPLCSSDRENYMRRVQESVWKDEQLKNQIKNVQLDQQLADFQKQLSTMIQQEEAYERKLEQDESRRIESEKNVLKEAITKESSKATELIADIRKYAEDETSQRVKEAAVKKQMNELLRETKETIAKRRGKLVEKINRMRTLSEIEKRRSVNELVAIKKSLSKQLIEIAKQGDPSKCFNLSNAESYCSAKFFNQSSMLNECLNPKQFCYLCCESELGIDKESKECCYNKCDSINEGSSCTQFATKYLVNLIN